MITIELTQGQVAQIDVSSAVLVSGDWTASRSRKSHQFYAVRTIYDGTTKRTELLHRAVMERHLGRQLKRTELVDHRNGDTLDCRLDNLRLATNAQNLSNRGKPRNNKTGFKGVSWNANAKLFVAYITTNYKRLHLGYFEDPETAAFAYNLAAIEHHGDFAFLNVL